MRLKRKNYDFEKFKLDKCQNYDILIHIVT